MFRMVDREPAVHRRADAVLVIEAEHVAELVRQDECHRVAVLAVADADLSSDDASAEALDVRLAGDLEPADADEHVRAPRVRRASSAASRWPVTDAVARPRALERASRLVPPGHMITVTTRRWARAWDVELEGVPGARRLVQPSYRGRAVEMLLPLLKIARHDPSATVIVLPADHGIDHEARFLRYASRAVWAVALRPDLPILIGAHPHAPVHGGWIEPGAPVEGLEELAVRAVKRFVDVASPAERRRLFEGNALTSTLIFVGRAGTLRFTRSPLTVTSISTVSRGAFTPRAP